MALLDKSKHPNIDEICSGSILITENMINFKLDEIDKPLSNLIKKISNFTLDCVQAYFDEDGFKSVKSVFDSVMQEKASFDTIDELSTGVSKINVNKQKKLEQIDCPVCTRKITKTQKKITCMECNKTFHYMYQNQLH